MTIVTISILALFCIIALVITLTWGMTYWYIYRRIRGEVIQMEKCPFKTPCLKYNEVQTKEAVRRVAKLILQNMEAEELHKKKLYEDLASGKLG